MLVVLWEKINSLISFDLDNANVVTNDEISPEISTNQGNSQETDSNEIQQSMESLIYR